jgi:hypothetical protein
MLSLPAPTSLAVSFFQTITYYGLLDLGLIFITKSKPLVYFILVTIPGEVEGTVKLTKNNQGSGDQAMYVEEDDVTCHADLRVCSPLFLRRIGGVPAGHPDATSTHTVMQAKYGHHRS